MRLKPLKETNFEGQMNRKPDSTTSNVGEQCIQDRVSKKKLDDVQKSRLFACICVARHLNDASDCDETFDRDTYETTLQLMRPHLLSLDLDDDTLTPTTVKKVWIDFIRTGLVVGRPKLRDELRATRQNREDSIERSRKKETTSRHILHLAVVILAFVLPLLYLIGAQESSLPTEGTRSHIKTTELRMHYDRIDRINVEYRNALSVKKLKTIRTRIAMMQKEISILVLLGRSQDLQCKLDPTHCVGKIIANVTQLDSHGYIDAADTQLSSEKLINQLADSVDDNRVSGQRRIVMIDNLAMLPGDKVMHLFQFIDKDEYHKRRGLLVLVLYTDQEDSEPTKVRDADVVERVLLKHWSPYVPRDTLTSVISRICGTIVRIT